MSKIRFCNVEDGDCILFESNGRFGLIDTGDTAYHPQEGDVDYGNSSISYGADMYPRVKDFLNHFVNPDRKIDWILCTHCHSDHVGNVVEIVNDYDVGMVYIRPYSHETNIRDDCKHRYFDNQYQYNRIIDNVPADKICHDIPNEIDLGDIHITNYFNDITPLEDENMQSIISLVEMDGKRIGLIGDVQNSPMAGTTDIDKSVADTLGELDVLKCGHHGLQWSNSLDLLNGTNPSLVINSGRIGYLQSNPYNPMSFFDENHKLINTVGYELPYVEI